MKRTMMATAIGATLLAVSFTGLPAVHAQAPRAPGTSAKHPTIEQFLKIRAPGGADVGADGTMYVRDWPDGIFQLYRVVPAKGASGADYSPAKATSTRLTSFADGLGSFSLSPDGTRILLSHAVGGNENFQLSLLDPKSGAISAITTKPTVQYSLNTWLDDGSGFIYSGNQESPNDFYLYKWDFATSKSTKILGKEGSWQADDVSKDGKRALVAKYNSSSDTIAYELDLASGTLTDITLRPEGGTAANSVVGYMPGDEQVLITSDYKDGMQRLYMRDLKTGSATSPTPALDAFELDGAGFNVEKTMLAAAVNEDGYGVPQVFTVPGFKAVALPKVERGVVGAGSFRGNRLIWTQNNARTPGLAFASTLGESSSTTQLTWAETQGVDLAGFPLPDLVKFKSFDGVEIPAFVFFPPGYDKASKKPIPFICLYHGGPEGQHRPTFSAQQQYFLSQGFGIMLPNVRGSTGYGRGFLMMDDYKKRWDSVRDGVAAAKWLVGNGYASAGKIATFGGSYGGYMSVACLVEDTIDAEKGKRAAYFGAGVDVVGVVNLKTFLEKTSGYRRKLREVEYGPLSDPEFLLSASPGTMVDKIRVPVFIAHGFNDPRVPIDEATQLAYALRAQAMAGGKPELMPQLLVFPDEGHGFAKLDNRLLYAKQTAAFLSKTIGK